LVEELASDALKDRHWEQIFTVLGVPYPAEAEFSINNLLEYDVISKFEEVIKKRKSLKIFPRVRVKITIDLHRNTYKNIRG
jgi:hypothetical protein